MSLSPRQLTTLKHLGYMLVVGAGGAALAWLAGPGPGDLFGSPVALIVVPSVTALISAVVVHAKNGETETDDT